jgi:hypothetical protein
MKPEIRRGFRPDSNFPNESTTLMKTRLQPSRGSRGTLVSCGAIALASLLIDSALAAFSGQETLNTKSSNWEQLAPDIGGAKLVFQGSRLEFRVKSPANDNQSALRWTPNEGGYDENWFIQVDVHLDTLTMNKGSFTRLDLGVFNTKHPKQEYRIGFDRSRTEGLFENYVYTNRIVTSSVCSCWPLGPAVEGTNVKFRLHFDSHSKTLTGSWKSGAYWKYFEPEPISTWGMDDADTFTATLTASGGGFDEETLGPVVSAGTAWFRNFKAGTARPEMAVDQPAGSGMKNGTAKRTFGTVPVGRSATRTFAIHNMGTAKLNNLKITKSGPNPADFNVIQPSTTTLKPGASTDFRITISPKGLGTRKAKIHISSNDRDEAPFDINLVGEGVK